MSSLDTLLSSLLLHAATVFGVLLALLLVSRVLRSPREPAATVAWLSIIIFLPFLGIPLYLAFGERKLGRLLRRKRPLVLPRSQSQASGPVQDLLVSLGIPAATSGNSTRFHANGDEAWEDLESMLASATRCIDVAMFILADDDRGRSLLALLEKKSREGVRIRLLLDGVGSFKLPRHYVKTARSAGIDIVWFIPVLHPPLRGKTNLRNHRKIVLVDDLRVWTGGRNLAREYLCSDFDGGCWIDLSFSHAGPAVSVYRALFEEDWRFATNAPPEESALPLPPTDGMAGGRVQVVPSGPDVADDPIHAAMLLACYEARHNIIAVTPYYVPDAGLQEALRLAALRGVTVDLILPARSNHRLADIARSRYLRELASAGARLWLVSGGMVHAKALVIDESLAFSGSANLDIRSLFLNCEVVSLFHDPEEVQWLRQWLEGLRDKSRSYQPPPAGASKELLEGVVELLAYQL